MLVTMKCPSCGATLEIDDAREFMFCQYCGTKIANLTEKIEVSGKVAVDNSAAIDNLLRRAYEFEQNGQIEDAISYYNRVLDLDFNCATARVRLSELNLIINKPNVFISFKSLNPDCILQTSIDNSMITRYRNGDIQSFTIGVGQHIVKFRVGSRRYSREITILDRNTRINVNYILDRKNRIEITG